MIRWGSWFVVNGSLLSETKRALQWLVNQTRKLNVTLIVGAPLETFDGRVFNTAFVISRGNILGAVPKTHLVNYGEYYEKRWFISGANVNLDVQDEILGKFKLSPNQIFQIQDMKFAIEICEDAWVTLSPSTYHTLAGANVIFNLSASIELAGKAKARARLVEEKSARQMSTYVYVSSGPSESTKDYVFGGHALIAENGTLLAENKLFQKESILYGDLDLDFLQNARRDNKSFGNQVSGFQERAAHYTIHTLPAKTTLSTLNRTYSPHPFTLEDPSAVLEIQAEALARRIQSAHSQAVLIGMSGGLDSTWALVVAIEAAKKLRWNPEQIYGITMPGLGTSPETRHSAEALVKSFGATFEEIDIKSLVLKKFEAIDHDPKRLDVTFENTQSRERTNILFNITSQRKALLLGTDDLTEEVLGWNAYGGDHMYSYGVNGSVPKTQIRSLTQWYAEERANSVQAHELQVVAERVISPELLPPSETGQIQHITEDIVGPHELHDFFTVHFLKNKFAPSKIFILAQRTFPKYSGAELEKWLHQFLRWFTVSQFKRTAMPPGNVKTGPVGVSNRGDLRLPDESDCAWLLKK